MQYDLNFYFDNYLSMGLSPILLQHRSKKPLLKNWNLNYNHKIWQKIIKQNSEKNFNIAILLGKVVDVEGDTPEANELLLNLIGDYPHPCFHSSRSIHHLFLNPDPTLTVKRFHDIEFRGNKVCSVMPPSVHEDGTTYRFLKCSEFPIPVMPPDLREYYFKNLQAQSKPKSVSIKPKVKKYHTKTLCNKCNQYQFLHKKRLALEVKAFKIYDMKWICRKCRNVDIRDICRNIRFDSRKH